jgi:hypothetical protein
VKGAPVIVVGSLIVALLLGETVYQLFSGKLLARGWKPYLSREQNPMLYWSSIGLQIVVVLVVICVICLAVLGAKS